MPPKADLQDSPPMPRTTGLAWRLTSTPVTLTSSYRGGGEGRRLSECFPRGQNKSGQPLHLHFGPRATGVLVVGANLEESAAAPLACAPHGGRGQAYGIDGARLNTRPHARVAPERPRAERRRIGASSRRHQARNDGARARTSPERALGHWAPELSAPAMPLGAANTTQEDVLLQTLPPMETPTPHQTWTKHTQTSVELGPRLEEFDSKLAKKQSEPRRSQTKWSRSTNLGRTGPVGWDQPEFGRCHTTDHRSHTKFGHVCQTLVEFDLMLFEISRKLVEAGQICPVYQAQNYPHFVDVAPCVEDFASVHPTLVELTPNEAKHSTEWVDFNLNLVEFGPNVAERNPSLTEPCPELVYPAGANMLPAAADRLARAVWREPIHEAFREEVGQN